MKNNQKKEKKKKNCTQYRDSNEIQKMTREGGVSRQISARSTGRRIRHRRRKYEKEVKGSSFQSLPQPLSRVESRVLDNNGSAGNERPHGYPQRNSSVALAKRIPFFAKFIYLVNRPTSQPPPPLNSIPLDLPMAIFSSFSLPLSLPLQFPFHPSRASISQNFIFRTKHEAALFSIHTFNEPLVNRATLHFTAPRLSIDLMRFRVSCHSSK